MDDRNVGQMPVRLVDWPPFFWRRVLFPGFASSTTDRPRWLSLALLVLLPSLMLYPCLGFALFEPDESRYAEIPREMLERGDLVVPYLQGEPYLDKPPLFYWLVAASYLLFGVHIAAARLVPALAVHCTILALYLFGARRFGERSAFWGALALLLAPAFLGMGRLLLLDSLLTLWTTLALFAAYEAVRGERINWSWWLFSAASCGLGMLTKGPVALVLLAPPILLQRWLTGTGCRLSYRAISLFLGVALAIALPWYVAVCWRIPDFAWTFVWEHHVLRFLTPFAHERGIWFYGPVLLTGLLPATLLIVPFLRFLGTSDGASAASRNVDFSYLLLSSGWCVCFFTLSACKLPTYVLPAFPPLALALGYFIVCAGYNRWRATRLVTVGSLALLFFTHVVALPWYASYRSPVRSTDDLARLCSDPAVTVVCYPRNCDSASFFLGRADLHAYRSKDIEELRTLIRQRPRTVILCTHRHALRGLEQLLPPDTPIIESVHHGLGAIPGIPKGVMAVLAKLMGETALGLCDVAVVEPRATDRPIPPASSLRELDPFEMEEADERP